MKVLGVFKVASFGKDEIVKAAENPNFDDFEDALQFESVKLSEIDYIITRDDDFQKSTIPVLTPRDFIELMSGKKIVLGIFK